MLRGLRGCHACRTCYEDAPTMLQGCYEDVMRILFPWNLAFITPLFSVRYNKESHI